jgi:DNA invertase Pin-like site-specific DNA recombinase
VTRVAAYCRVSTDKEDQINSFESQKRFFEDYIRRQPGWVMAGIYADEGVTGTSTAGRCGFARLIDDARRGLFELVLTKEVSRFSRNILDAIAYTRLLKSLGVGVVFLNDGISTLDPDAELRLGIMASVAQEESRKTSERVKWGQRRQMERGVVFGRSLLGYTVSGGKLSIEPQGATVVRLIFELFVNQRLGTRAIAQRLTDMGLITPSGGTIWSPATILKIIKNEKYCGDLLQRKTVTPDYLTHKKTVNRDKSSQILLRDHHEPIVSRALWEAAQAERRRRTADGGRSGGHGSRYALSGRIRCAECGAVFLCRTKKRRDGSAYRVWRSTCRHGIRQLREDWIARCVRSVVASYREPVLSAVLEALSAETAEKNGNTAATLAALRRLAQKRIALADKYVSGEIAMEDYFSLRDRFKIQAQDIALRLMRMKNPQEGEDKAVITAAGALAGGTDPEDAFYLRLISRLESGCGGQVAFFLEHQSQGLRFTYKSAEDINNGPELC